MTFHFCKSGRLAEEDHNACMRGPQWSCVINKGEVRTIDHLYNALVSWEYLLPEAQSEAVTYVEALVSEEVI